MGATYLAEYLGAPVAAMVVTLEDYPGAGASSSADRNNAASTISLPEIATSELRRLASLLPAHPRLARTHGSEASPVGIPGTGSVGGGSGAGAALVLVGELVDGGSLRARLDARAAADAASPDVAGGTGAGDEGGASIVGGERGRLETGEKGLRWRRVVSDVAEGLAYLHERGVFHGALSSENVLLDDRGRAKV